MGERIHFTRIVMGDGYLPPDTVIREMTDVVHSVVSVPITKLKMNADGSTVVIGGVFTNADISTEFFYRELALFAQGEDNAEVMYCYGNAGDFAERITPVGGSSVIEKAIDVVTAIGTAENVTATIVRTVTADEVSYDDKRTNLGADNVQGVIEILASGGFGGNRIITVSDDAPEEPYAIWLKPMGGVSIADAVGGGTILQTINVSGAHIGYEPPDEKSKLWFNPLTNN
jgi:hypothetical protein